MSSSAADLTVASLLAHGIDTLYALPGVHNDHFFDAVFRAGDKIRTVHSRHEQGAAYMALGAALATNKPQPYAVVPGPGLLNTSAALLTAYSMNAPVLALIGQIPDGDIGKGLSHLHEIKDQAGIISRLVDFSARVKKPEEASTLVAQAIQSLYSDRPGPAAIECAIDMWGRKSADEKIAPALSPRQPTLDGDAIKDAAKRLANSKRPLIVCGGGAQGASAEITQLAEMLQAPVLGYRRGRGVLSSKSPFSVTLPLGRELWGEADAALGIGTHMLYPMLHWGMDDDIQIIRVDADKDEPARIHKPAVSLIGDAQPILKRLVEVLPSYLSKREPRTGEMRERHAKMNRRFVKISPQKAFLDAIREELPDDGIFVDEVTQMGFAARLALPGL